MVGGRLLAVCRAAGLTAVIPDQVTTESSPSAAELKRLARARSCRIRSAEGSDPGDSNMRPRISYANVVSTLALVLALGGVSYAAVKINGKSIKDRTVTAKKIKKNALTGTEINEAKLGKVPLAGLAGKATNATHATDADTVGGKAPTSYKLSCPQGTTLVIGQCFETALRPDANWSDANKACGAAGRRLPTLSELESARQNNFTVGVPPNNYELTSTFLYADNPPTEQVMQISPAGNRLHQPPSTAKPFRCIQNPTN